MVGAEDREGGEWKVAVSRWIILGRLVTDIKKFQKKNDFCM